MFKLLKNHTMEKSQITQRTIAVTVFLSKLTAEKSAPPVGIPAEAGGENPFGTSPDIPLEGELSE